MAIHYGNPHSLGHRVAIDTPNRFTGRRVADGFSSEEDAERISHAINCKQCSSWISEVVGEKVLRRQSRLAQYCCSQLFGAIEEPKRSSLPIKLSYDAPERLEGAHRWILSLADDKIGRQTLFINYCPFCGELIETPEHQATNE